MGRQRHHTVGNDDRSVAQVIEGALNDLDKVIREFLLMQVSGCRNQGNYQMSNFRQYRGWRQESVIKNMIVSFQPKVSEDGSREEVLEWALMYSDGGNPSGPNL